MACRRRNARCYSQKFEKALFGMSGTKRSQHSYRQEALQVLTC